MRMSHGIEISVQNVPVKVSYISKFDSNDDIYVLKMARFSATQCPVVLRHVVLDLKSKL